MPKSKQRKGRRTRRGPTQSKSPVAPTRHKESSVLYQAIMFGLMAVGLVVILANYIGLLPGDTNNTYLVAGLGAIAVGFAMTLWYN